MRKSIPRFAVVTAVVIPFSWLWLREQPDNGEREDSVYLAAIRYSLIEDGSSYAPALGRVVFIRMNGIDPTPKFLSQLRVPKRDVRPGSRAKGIERLKSGGRARDRLTGDEGEYLNFSAIQWNNPVPRTFDPLTGEASVTLERIGPSSHYSDYELSRKNGKWEVIDRAYAISQ